MTSRCGDDEGLDGILVADDIGEVEPIVHRVVAPGRLDRVDHDRFEFTAVPDRGIPQRTDRHDLDSRHEPRLPRVARGHHHDRSSRP